MNGHKQVGRDPQMFQKLEILINAHARGGGGGGGSLLLHALKT